MLKDATPKRPLATPHMELIAKRDGYLKRRGGTFRFLDLSCASCHTLLAVYQKDGPGQLLRLYLDRLLSGPLDRTGACPSCRERIGGLFVYAPEQRQAIRLRPGAISKRLHR